MHAARVGGSETYPIFDSRQRFGEPVWLHEFTGWRDAVSSGQKPGSIDISGVIVHSGLNGDRDPAPRDQVGKIHQCFPVSLSPAWHHYNACFEVRRRQDKNLAI
jgi:hypothetical protein